MIQPIVSVDWLKEHLTDPDLILLDASPESNISNLASAHQEVMIPGSRHFDLKGKFSDPDSPFPNTLPSEAQFEYESRKLGINKTSRIIVYDNLGIYTSPRVWWMFRAMGHHEVAVLDGGLPEWILEGHSTVSRQFTDCDPGDFEARLDGSNVKSYEDMVSNIAEKNYLVVDARSKGRFNGTEKEPRKGLKSGHMANSVNIPFEWVLEGGKFKSPGELKDLFDGKIDKERELTFSCGSGLTACIVLLACELVHDRRKSVYDGSWTEWAELQGLKEN